GDPVQTGLVASLNQPGGNVTGFTTTNSEIGTKRLGLLHELVPDAARYAILANPNNLAPAKQVQAEAVGLGLQVEILTVSSTVDVDASFVSIVQQRAQALIVNPNPVFANRRVQLVTLAARHAIPAIYYDRPYSEAGGLMSYGVNIPEQHRQAGLYVGRILKGEKPSELPVQQPTRFEFIINLQTARALDVSIPP